MALRCQSVSHSTQGEVCVRDSNRGPVWDVLVCLRVEMKQSGYVINQEYHRYHSHSELQRADGLYGGLIIHNPEELEAEKYQYDQELLFLIGDWYHFSGKEIFAIFEDPTSNGNEPCPISFLINGLGSFDCSYVIPAAPVNCSATQIPRLSLDKKLRYRFRIVNVGYVHSSRLFFLITNTI